MSQQDERSRREAIAVQLFAAYISSGISQGKFQSSKGYFVLDQPIKDCIVSAKRFCELFDIQDEWLVPPSATK